jgi:hypothetical protein
MDTAYLARLSFAEQEMAFITEGDGYEKTILSDLQHAWILLRESVVEMGRFDNWNRLLLHIDEAMSGETVRKIDRMPPLLLIIRNLRLQGEHLQWSWRILKR